MQTKWTGWRGVVAAVGLTAALLTPAPAAVGQGEASPPGAGAVVRSDGRRMSAPEAAMTTMSSSFEGSGVLSPTSGPSIERTIAAVPATLGRESIIGIDERQRITPTTTFPARAITLITFSVGTGTARCSGWMSGPDTVVTAGHCVAGGGSFYSPASYTVTPAYDGTVAPYGSCGVTSMITSPNFFDFEDERYDYGVLKLNCYIGLTTGWLGFFWKPTAFDGASATISGYPGDKLLTQWRSSGTITFTGGRMLYYSNDTTAGTSGSGVYRLRRTGASLCAGYCVMAIHTQGLHGSFPHNTYNHGVRITEDVWATLLVTLLPSFWA